MVCGFGLKGRDSTAQGQRSGDRYDPNKSVVAWKATTVPLSVPLKMLRKPFKDQAENNFPFLKPINRG